MEATLNSKSNTVGQSSVHPLVAGIVTGQFAGLIMAVVVMAVFTIFLGQNPLYPVQVIGSALLGESALKGFNVMAILAGLVLHQVGPSLLWGFVFGLLAKKFSIQTVAGAAKLGIAMGVFSMVGPYFLIPFVMNTLHGVDIWNREVPMFWDWAAHLIFGVSFALYPQVIRKLS